MMQFSIEPFKHPLADPEYKVKTWKLLEDAIHQINNQNTSSLSFEELYRNAYNMVVNKFGGFLYDGMVNIMTKHLKDVAATILHYEREEFLVELDQRWRDHNKAMQMIGDILMYMDRIYVKQYNKVPVAQVTLDLWRDHVVCNSAIRAKCQGIVLNYVHKDRSGECIPRPLIKAVTEMLVKVGIRIYQDELEDVFLQHTEEYFRAEAQNYVATDDCASYMAKVSLRLEAESERVRAYFDQSTIAKVIKIIEKEMIATHMPSLVENSQFGIISMIDSNCVEVLRLMYSLMRRIENGLNIMKGLLGQHLRGVGKGIVQRPENQVNSVLFVDSLLALRHKYDRLAFECFGADKSFSNTVNSSFEYFMNLNPRAPEFLSLYLDEKLRKGAKTLKMSDAELLVDGALSIFRNFSEKDVFEKYYKQRLARRLLSNRALSDDLERMVLRKLKEECGYQYTAKMESMFKDICNSRKFTNSYGEYLSNSIEENLPDFKAHFQILTTGCWPIDTHAHCILPQEFAESCKSFDTFYSEKFTGRKLTWQPGRGSAEVIANFPSGQFELNLTTHHTIVLLLFNDHDTLSFSDILKRTAIPINELKHVLQALSCSKSNQNLLRKEPPSQTVSDNDIFHYNDNFSSNSTTLRMDIAASQSEPVAARIEARREIEEDRKPLIEATIIKIMKLRKRMEFNALLTEIQDTLNKRFEVDPALVKKRLESLMEREFLARDERDHNFCLYIA